MGISSSTSRPVFAKAAAHGGLNPIAATVGDHAGIEYFLSLVFPGPGARDFQTQIEDPFYEPNDRLLIKEGSQIVAHVRKMWRTMLVGSTSFPIGVLTDLGVLPEYRSRGLAEKLFATAARDLRAHHVTLLAFDEQSSAVSEDGWIEWHCDASSQASPRDILAQIAAWEEQLREAQPLASMSATAARLSVRHWRHVELPALMRTYRANHATACGMFERSEAYWRWLIGRDAFDQIFVAIEGDDRLSLEEEGCRIVGYAVIRDGQVLELMTEPDHPTAGHRLLARVCADAIERDWHTLRLHGPPDHVLHALMREAGGSFHRCRSGRGTRQMVLVPEPIALLEKIGPALAQRAVDAGLALPTEIGLRIDSKKWQLRLSREGATLLPNKLGRSYVTCDMVTWTQLLLGSDDATVAIEDGRLEPSTTVAADLITSLFSQAHLWRPPWDQLPG